MGICIAVGALCILYYLMIVIYAGITADFAWFWLAAGIILIGCGFLISYGHHHLWVMPRWLRYTVMILMVAGTLCFTIICGGIATGMLSQGSDGLDYVVVLGAQVKGEVPSRALSKRLQQALNYALKNENTILILSGGQGSGEDITEAQCMKNYLMTCGISEDRLILEEKSTTTKENLEFSAAMTDCARKKTGILSNNFHVYRAVKLARKLGYEQAEGIAAPSDPVMQIHYIVREACALVKEKMVGNI
ncbi:MAG: YdcF family protein [Lachnospiraceae bacterium]|nr:YdcF family protein [Lachnospiraceae bacterium]